MPNADKKATVNITGKWTKKQYKVATIFVDHYSDLNYVHVQESTLAEMQSRLNNILCFCIDQGVKIQHYHAGNRIFASKGFQKAVKESRQTITFCRVEVNHQNSIAKKGFKTSLI